MLCGLSSTPGQRISSVNILVLAKSKFQPRYPCGMCGAGVAIGTVPPSELHAAPGETSHGCYTWVEKEKGVLKGKYSCQLVGDGTIGLATTAKSSLVQPCTNMPFKCAEKDCLSSVQKRIAKSMCGPTLKSSSKWPSVLTRAFM